MNDQQTFLKYCPFCGGEAELHVGGNYNRKLERRTGVYAKCKDCKTRTPSKEGINCQEVVLQLWNQRAVE